MDGLLIFLPLETFPPSFPQFRPGPECPSSPPKRRPSLGIQGGTITPWLLPPLCGPAGGKYAPSIPLAALLLKDQRR